MQKKLQRFTKSKAGREKCGGKGDSEEQRAGAELGVAACLPPHSPAVPGRTSLCRGPRKAAGVKDKEIWRTSLFKGVEIAGHDRNTGKCSFLVPLVTTQQAVVLGVIHGWGEVEVGNRRVSCAGPGGGL